MVISCTLTAAAFVLLLVGCLFITGCCGAGSSTAAAGPVQAKIQYDGKWTGAGAVGGSCSSIEGTGPKTIDLPAGSGHSVTVSKADTGMGKLQVDLIQGGKVVKTGETSAPYGAVSVLNI